MVWPAIAHNAPDRRGMAHATAQSQLITAGDATMRMRTRKLLGTFALLAFVILYSLAAMMVAIVLQVNASKLVEVLYYIIAGLAWVFPAGGIIWWMQKPD